jgi:hypothetical protein
MVNSNDPTMEEVRYVLRSSRAMAPHVVRILAALERQHFAMAEVFLADAIAAAGQMPRESQDTFIEALTCSDAMVQWRKSRNLSSGAGLIAPSAASQTPRSESTVTPNAADAAA